MELQDFHWGNFPLVEQSCYTPENLSRAVTISLGKSSPARAELLHLHLENRSLEQGSRDTVMLTVILWYSLAPDSIQAATFTPMT